MYYSKMDKYVANLDFWRSFMKKPNYFYAVIILVAAIILAFVLGRIEENPNIADIKSATKQNFVEQDLVGKNAENSVCLSASNSRNSLDWAGVYAGVIPCADCPGIDVEISLNLDETFRAVWFYMDRETSIFTTSGVFTWDETCNVIDLDLNNFPRFFHVGEGRLFLLGQNGERIHESIWDHNTLLKVE